MALAEPSNEETLAALTAAAQASGYSLASIADAFSRMSMSARAAGNSLATAFSAVQQMEAMEDAFAANPIPAPHPYRQFTQRAPMVPSAVAARLTSYLRDTIQYQEPEITEVRDMTGMVVQVARHGGQPYSFDDGAVEWDNQTQGPSFSYTFGVVGPSHASAPTREWADRYVIPWLEGRGLCGTYSEEENGWEPGRVKASFTYLIWPRVEGGEESSSIIAEEVPIEEHPDFHTEAWGPYRTGKLILPEPAPPAKPPRKRRGIKF